MNPASKNIFKVSCKTSEEGLNLVKLSQHLSVVFFVASLKHVIIKWEATS